MTAPGRSDDLVMAHHDLMDRIAIAADEDGLAYRRIQRHEKELQRWYRQNPNWAIVRTREQVRLVRRPSIVEAGRGLTGLNAPQDYALLCWILWYGERLFLSAGEGLFLLSDMADEIVVAAADPLGPDWLDLKRHLDRAALIRALRCLEGLAVIRRLEGEADEWMQGRTEANVLYEFTPLAQQLLAGVDRAALRELALAEPLPAREPVHPDPQPMVRAWRALLLGPALHRLDDPEAFAALVAAQRTVGRELQRTLGWDLDVRADYACILRETMAQHAAGTLLDAERKHIYHPILLLCGHYRSRVQTGELRSDAHGVLTVPLESFGSEVWRIRERWKENWGTTLGDMGYALLCEEVLAEMRRAGLLRGPDATGHVHLLPAAARFTAHYETADEPPALKTRREASGADAVALRLF